jgi:hypothetical protein
VGLRGIISYYEGDPGAELAITQIQAVCGDPAAGVPTPALTPPFNESGVNNERDRNMENIPGAGTLTTPPAGTAPPVSTGGSSSSSAAIAGGVAGGGAAVVILISVATWVLWHRRQQQQQQQQLQYNLKGDPQQPDPLLTIAAASLYEAGKGDGSVHPVGPPSAITAVPSVMYSTLSDGTLIGTPTAREAANGQDSPLHVSNPSGPDVIGVTAGSNISHQQLRALSQHPDHPWVRHPPHSYTPGLSGLGMGNQEQPVPTVHHLVWVQPGQLEAQQQAQRGSGEPLLVLVDALRLLGTGCYGWVSGSVLLL